MSNKIVEIAENNAKKKLLDLYQVHKPNKITLTEYEDSKCLG